jgi:hypothetical protein
MCLGLRRQNKVVVSVARARGDVVGLGDFSGNLANINDEGFPDAKGGVSAQIAIVPGVDGPEEERSSCERKER